MRWWNLGYWQGYLSRKTNPIRRERKREARALFRVVREDQATQARAIRAAREEGRPAPRPRKVKLLYARLPAPAEGVARDGSWRPSWARKRGNTIRVDLQPLSRAERRALNAQDRIERGHEHPDGPKHHLNRRQRAAMHTAWAKGWA